VGRSCATAPGQSDRLRRQAKDNHLFFNAVVWLMRTGVPWADLPERFGKPNSVCRRFRRLAQKGVGDALFEARKAPELA